MKKIPTDVNPKIGKLVGAIAQKRRELGLLEWGQLPIEEVVNRLQEKPPTEELSKLKSTLASQDQTQQAENAEPKSTPEKAAKKPGPPAPKTAKPRRRPRPSE